MNDDSFSIPIYATHFTLSDRPFERYYRYICLACLQAGQITYTTSPRMLCRKHGAEFREWRRRHKLPAVRARAYIPRTDPDQRKKRESQILRIMRCEGPIKLNSLANKLPWASADVLRTHLRRLERQGHVEKIGKGPSTKWSIVES